MRLSDLRGRTVAVWGTGREGRAAVIAIAAHGPAGLVAVDDSANFLALPWEGPLAEAAPLVTGEDGFARLAAAEVVVRSPGVPNTHPWLVELRRRGVTVTQGSALWMADHARRTVGVTGSKGKSTTSSLISHLLTAVDRPNVFGGNIGVPLLDLPDADLYVLELSSYQCADLTDSPRVAVVTALFPEHLDAHGGEREYYRDKLNLLAHGPQTIVVNGADPRLAAELGDRPAVRAGAPDTTHVAPGPDGTPWFHLGDRPLFARAVLPLVGRHNEGNLCVALAVLDALGVDVAARADTLAVAVAGFQGLAHRLTEIADPSGLTFVDDTLATSPYAAMHAIDAYEGRPLTVIVGGTDRGLDYAPLREHLAEREITVLGIPDSGERIVAALAGLPKVRAEVVDDLVAAVGRAREVTPAGGVVLLSPAAPSYGRFRNFEHRSEVFAEAVRDTATHPVR
ncbi:UDP-N-acetylmuramoyl-L-alanine--D-glutamate ligase [Micromonospora carbonacea]|uniref:UDP-N-acetylmuramoyl-L-alanine--L-glutamate ligase n=1 Tax=Micromonospora carbonacea TaxID=47853 RepID=A0A1C4X4K7_9ACTN|nr:UDP-N-acetylmuramoyl-L-alanine--D-glutamate ligase [Micromonospora carbonacea]MBB5825489.1 UDP-N-acetylmuramoylalanine--D-glutamate ligase [Micromonospora carbonacea]QLD26465.1 UDP-N-acetylmuramoyl-L-alanine--D-glutamate ligase [Micromonospora carbonacea]SCF03324.1 UDP-N-acetylmuramoylalanine--D-glutamate ligase [Micromonospora carbonacea]